jgi:ankyrin repeat protein
MLERIADGRTDLVFDFLAQGHSANAMDGGGVSLIQWCAYYGDVSAVRYLVSRGASLAALGENLDLNGASFHGHWQLCEFLIEHGADVNYELRDTGETPLHAALCKANRPAYNLVLKVLLANGADPNRPTKVGVETGSFMRDCRTRGETPLHRAAAFGNAEAIQLLLDAGAVIDARDAHGDTPLSWASWHLRPGAILRMLCYGGHSVSPGGVAHYTGDHGMGWGGLEASLRGKPHAEPSATPDRGGTG